MYLNNYQSSIFGIAILGLLFFIACEKTIETSKVVDFGAKATVYQEKSVWFGTDTLTGVNVTVEEIADSRCAEDVECVWAGEAKVKLMATSKSDTVALDLTISTEKNSKTDTLSFGLNDKNYKALLYSVDPYPNTKIKAVKSATFTILKSN